MLVISCQKKEKTNEVLATKFWWEPGISAPKYYPVAGNVNFGNAGHGSNTSFDNGWGEEYGGVVSGNMYKEIPQEVSVDYYSVVDSKDFKGIVKLDQEKILQIFRKYCKQKSHRANLTVGMAPGGWIRVWFNMMTGNEIDSTSKFIHIEIAKSQLKGYENNNVGIGLKTKDFKTWGNTYSYWKHHGIPYESWAENEKEYDIVFDFNKPNQRKVSFSYISSDGTYYQGEQGNGEVNVNKKLPIQIEQMPWLSRSGTSYCCKVPMPKNFKKYIDQKKLKQVRLELEIENDDEHAILYLVTNNTKEKIVRFKNKQPTEKEIKDVDFAYATEIEYFIK